MNLLTYNSLHFVWMYFRSPVFTRSRLWFLGVESDLSHKGTPLIFLSLELILLYTIPITSLLWIKRVFVLKPWFIRLLRVQKSPLFLLKEKIGSTSRIESGGGFFFFFIVLWSSKCLHMKDMCTLYCVPFTHLEI